MMLKATARRCNPMTILLLFLLGVFTISNLKFVWSYADTLSCYNLRIDTDTYDNIARAIVESGSFEPIPIGQPPGFVIFLAAVYKTLGIKYLPIKLIYCFLTLGIALCVWWMGSCFLGEAEGFVSAVLVISSPMLRAYSATLQGEILAAFLLTAAFAVLLRGTKQRSTTRSLLSFGAAAVLAGLAALTREVLVLVIPLMVAYTGLSWSNGLRSRFTAAAIVLLVAGSIVGVWIWRQSAVTGHFVAVSTKAPLVLAFGNNPNSDGSFRPGRAVGTPFGWEFMKRQPDRFIRLMAAKFLYFWGISKDAWNVPRPAALVLSRSVFHFPDMNVWLTLARSVLPLFCLLGILLSCWNGSYRSLWILPASMAGVMAAHLVLLSSHRFAVPILPLAFLFSAAGMVHLGRLINRNFKLKQTLLAGFVLLLVAGIGSVLNPSGELRVEAETLDGIRIEEVVDELASNSRALFSSKAEGLRRVALVTEEVYPRGFLSTTVRFRTDPGCQESVLGITVAADRIPLICTRTLRCDSTAAYQEATGVCYLPSDAVARIEVSTLAEQNIWLDQLKIGIAQGAAALPFRYVLFSSFDTEVELLDFGSAEEERVLPGRGWSSNEETPDLDFQWALGKSSELFVPLHQVYDLSLELHLLPFLPDPDMSQSITVQVNGRRVEQLRLMAGWQKYSLQIPAGYLIPGLNTFVFEYENWTKPADHGESLDRRDLAVAWDYIRLKRTFEDPPEKSSR